MSLLDAPPALMCLVLGFVALAVGAVALAYMLVVRGRTRAMTSEELTNRMMRYTAEDQVSYAVSTGVGVRREVSFGIDDLRNLAKRGEWKLFWAFPVAFSGFGFGLLLVLVAASIFFKAPIFAIAAAVCCIPLGCFGWFMAWAAIYTKIDLGTADPPEA